MTDATPDAQARARAEFDDLVRDVRPALHRYCARMVGSSIEGEDVVQDALAKAYYQLSRLGGVSNVRGWLFRIAHNKALDHLKRYEGRFADRLDHDLPAPDGEPVVERHEVARWGLSFFTKLTVMQRSCVILKDVLDYSLEEISDVLDASVPAIKGALHRGRASLRRMADAAEREANPAASAADAETPELSGDEIALLERYVERFNARDFDALREMLADDVRLDMVSRAQERGAERVGGYFTRYAAMADCTLRVGGVEGRAALPGADGPADQTGFFILIDWDGERIQGIKDYRYARWVLAEARRGLA
jgi:RNA polymerase sigma-70 factor (ECF subfamily)